LADAPHDTPLDALLDCVRHPYRNLVRVWNWKVGMLSALTRALVFLFSNRHHGAVKAMLVEAAYSIFASGVLGALQQRLRGTRPLWMTTLMVWIALPLAMVAGEAGVHHLVQTQHVRAGLMASLVIAAFASGFTWFAMRRGTLLQGVGDDSVQHDVKLLPRVVFDFVAWPVRRLAGRARGV
jgi:hypothetical protein